MSGSIVGIGGARNALRKWIEAREALAAGQSYSIGGRTLTRQDAETVEGMITRWHRTVLALEAHAAGCVRPLGSQALWDAPGSGGNPSLMSTAWYYGLR